MASALAVASTGLGLDWAGLDWTGIDAMKSRGLPNAKQLVAAHSHSHSPLRLYATAALERSRSLTTASSIHPSISFSAYLVLGGTVAAMPPLLRAECS